MPNDPGLAGDTCIFMEAVPGDGGAHNASGVWWLSPDINLTGPVSGPDKADPGQNNPVQVKFHRKAASTGCVFPGAESITVQLWVGNPSLVMTPNNPASTALVQSIGSPLPAEGASAIQVMDWTPPPGLPPSDPQSSGHKCLMAICYPDNLAPSPTSFFVPDDQHVAQHNICVVPCGAPGASLHPGLCGFKVTTINPNLHQAQTVTLRAVVDLTPAGFVAHAVSTRVHGLHGFRQLGTALLRGGFRFDLSPLHAEQVTDHSRPGTSGPLPGGALHPRYEAKVRLAPGRAVDVRFIADLTGAHPGDAYIFHLTQLGADLRPQGGMTLVMVAG